MNEDLIRGVVEGIGAGGALLALFVVVKWIGYCWRKVGYAFHRLDSLEEIQREQSEKLYQLRKGKKK